MKKRYFKPEVNTIMLATSYMLASSTTTVGKTDTDVTDPYEIY